MRSKRDQQDPEQMLRRYPGYRLKKTILKSEFVEFDDFEIFDYYYSDIESDDDVEKKPKEIIQDKKEEKTLKFNYIAKGDIYDVLYTLRLLSNQMLSAFESYFAIYPKNPSPMWIFISNFSAFIDTFSYGLKMNPIFGSKDSMASIREELAMFMFTLRFLMAENDFIIKRNSEKKWEFAIENGIKRVAPLEKNGHAKQIYHLLVDLMRYSFTPILEYKSSEFEDSYSTARRFGSFKYKSLFSSRDSGSPFIKTAFYDEEEKYDTRVKEVEDISLRKIVFQTPAKPGDVFKEIKNDPSDNKEMAKNILYRNIDFFKAAFDLEYPKLFQRWAKENRAYIKVLSDQLHEAIIDDIHSMQNKRDIEEKILADDKYYEDLRREGLKAAITPCIKSAYMMADLIIDYVPPAILNELENVIPGENNFHGVLHSIHKALKKAAEARNADHILSGFYAYGYNVNNYCINRRFLQHFVQTIIHNETLIDATANKWRECWSPQRLFKHRIIKERIKKDDPEQKRGCSF